MGFEPTTSRLNSLCDKDVPQWMVTNSTIIYVYMYLQESAQMVAVDQSVWVS